MWWQRLRFDPHDTLGFQSCFPLVHCSHSQSPVFNNTLYFTGFVYILPGYVTVKPNCVVKVADPWATVSKIEWQADLCGVNDSRITSQCRHWGVQRVLKGDWLPPSFHNKVIILWDNVLISFLLCQNVNMKDMVLFSALFSESQHKQFSKECLTEEFYLIGYTWATVEIINSSQWSLLPLTICMAVSMNDTPMWVGPRSTLSPEWNVTPFPVSVDLTRLLRLQKSGTKSL